MPTVPVELPHDRYDVVIEPGALDSLGGLVREISAHSRCLLIADEHVGRHYGQRAVKALKNEGFEVERMDLPAGEEHKTLETIRDLYTAAAEKKVDRRMPVLALGGGVVGDTAGFFAATWMRGLPLVQAPTSLLAMVDASVGGKTGVNLSVGKNLVGAFHQPALVVIDPRTLQTLPPRELRCGLAECAKHGVIRDESLFQFIENNLPAIRSLQSETMTELIRRNVEIKASLVAEDERESGIRAHLNFGHTYGHAIEAATGYGQIAHGEAVALGMIAAAHLSHSLKLCEESVEQEIRQLCDDIGLPTTADLPDNSALMKSMELDKKARDNRLCFILPEKIGRVLIRDDVPDERIETAWDAIRVT